MAFMQKHLPILLLVLGILQPLAGALAPLTGLGTPIGEATRGIDAPEQPLPVFFSIWSVIFLAYILFAIAVWRAREPWMIRIGTPLAIAGALNVVWMLGAQLIVSQLLDFLLLFPIAAAAWIAAYRLDTLRELGWSPLKALADAASGLLAGWISVAIAISIPLTIRNNTFLGPTDLPWNMLWITLITGGMAAWIFARYVSRSWWYFIALGWGLLGIVLNNWTHTGMHWLGITTGIALVLILLLRLFRRADGSTVPAQV